MLVNIKWLRELVDLEGLSTEKIVKELALHSIEIETTKEPMDSKTLVVGYCLEKQSHPNADKLSVLKVDVGDEVLQIVCGASNVDQGQWVIVAKAGSVLPGNFKIKRAKIRGVESCGMICSLQELGIQKKHIEERYAEGIFYFQEEKPLGLEAMKALEMDDAMIELGLTPNRGDLLSMIGVAYECSAVFQRPLKELSYTIMEKHQKSYCSIDIQSDDCKLYLGQVIQDVIIKPSPTWLVSRLIAFGIRPINNCVDITNYILALFGQPLHAFDMDTLGNTIVVRKAKDNEEMTTLDGQVRKLLKDDLLITDGVKPVALAGVMGGLDTEVTPSTRNILLEAAVFDPMSVRKTSSRLNLRSESSMRFERGVDLNRTKQALDYACYLFATLANAKIDFCGQDGITQVEEKSIALTTQDVNQLLGTKISKKDMISLLERLNFTVDYPMVLVPNRRSDITIKEDLIEEIVRLYGYDRLEATKPIDNQVGGYTPQQQTKRHIKEVLSNHGLHETLTYSLTHKGDSRYFDYLKPKKALPLEILMPLSEQRNVTRSSLVPSLLDVVAYNFARKNTNLALFELSNVYHKIDGNIEEKSLLSGALSHMYSHTLWKQKVERIDFFVVKGILENLWKMLEIDVDFIPLDVKGESLHPHRSAALMVDEHMIGYLGQIHPKLANELDIDDVYVFEIDLTHIVNRSVRKKKYKSISKLPVVERDIAILVEKDVQAGDVLNTIKKTDKGLSDVVLFDVYQKDDISKSKKSLGIRLEFSVNEALTEEKIQGRVQQIVKELEKTYQAELRR